MVQKSDYLPAFCPGGCVLPDVVRIGDAVVQSADHQGRRVSGCIYSDDGKVIKTASTRGNIYDRNGNVLAYNELAYDVTIQDTGAYKTDAQWNTMLYDLVSILNKHGESAQTSLELTLDHDGNVVYTSETQSGRKRFLRDYYGLKNVDEMDDSDGKYPSDISAPDLLERMKKEYHLTLGDDKNRDGRPLDKDGNPIDVSDEVALQIVGIRYTMRFTAFQKYESTTIATDISDETVADILEHAADLVGVNIQESTIRVYNESIYFAPIIGYTGKVTSERLEELKAVNDDYELNDVVGRTGIESSMELELKGKKGSQTAYVDNVGRILSVTGEVAPVAGNDIWLTLDLNLQKGIYHILEKQLAGVLLKTIVNQDEKDIAYIDSSSIKIPIKKAYFQLINNNVLSIDNFASEEASDVEQQIYQKYESSRVRIEQELRGELQSENATPMNALSEEMQAYMQYIYSYLSSSNKAIVQRDAIDTSSVSGVEERYDQSAGILILWNCQQLDRYDEAGHPEPVFECGRCLHGTAGRLFPRSGTGSGIRETDLSVFNQ